MSSVPFFPRTLQSLTLARLLKLIFLLAFFWSVKCHEEREERRSFRDTFSDSVVGARVKERHGPGAGRRALAADTTLHILSRVRDTIVALEGAVAAADASAAKRGATSLLRDIVVRPRPSRAITTPQHAATPQHHKPSLQAQYVQRNTPLAIECELPTNNDDVIWTKDNKSISEMSLALGVAVKGRLVTSPRARAEHAGLWSCSAGGSHFYFLLRVLDAAVPLYLSLDGRRLDAGNTWLPAIEGHLLNVSCVIEGDPASESESPLGWKLELSRGGEDPSSVTSSGSSSSGGTASVSVSRAHHNATLSCATRADHRVPSRASVLLDVSYPPAFEISREPGWGVPLVEGRSVELRCSSRSRPSSPPRWVKDDGPPPVPQTDRSLHFARLSREHAGWYRCEADYLGRTYASIGYYLNVRYEVDAPETSVAEGDGEASVDSSEDNNSSSTTVQVDLGGSVQLHCPKGSVGCWSRRQADRDGASAGQTVPMARANDEYSQPVTQTGMWLPAGSEHAHGVLGVNQAIYQDNGEYRCVGASREAPNHIKELRRVSLAVKGGPTVRPIVSGGNENRFESPIAVSARIGEHVKLAAEVCGDPVPQVLWLADGQILTPGSADLHKHLVAEPMQNKSENVCGVLILRVGLSEGGLQETHSGLYRLVSLGGGSRAAHLSWALRVTLKAPPAARANATPHIRTHLFCYFPQLLSFILQKIKLFAG